MELMNLPVPSLADLESALESFQLESDATATGLLQVSPTAAQTIRRRTVHTPTPSKGTLVGNIIRSPLQVPPLIDEDDCDEDNHPIPAANMSAQHTVLSEAAEGSDSDVTEKTPPKGQLNGQPGASGAARPVDNTPTPDMKAPLKRTDLLEVLGTHKAAGGSPHCHRINLQLHAPQPRLLLLVSPRAQYGLCNCYTPAK